MKDTSGFYFQSYQEWHQAITQRCNIKLTKEYAQKRISALRNTSDSATREFVSKYGNAYVDQVIEWFERAEKESA